MNQPKAGAEAAEDASAARDTSDAGPSQADTQGWYERLDPISFALNERFLAGYAASIKDSAEENEEVSPSRTSSKDPGEEAVLAAAASASRKSRGKGPLKPKRSPSAEPGLEAVIASPWKRVSKYYAPSNTVPIDVQSILQRENPYDWGKKLTKEHVREGASELVVVSPKTVLSQALLYERWGNEAAEAHLKVKYHIFSARRFTLLAHHLETSLKMPDYATAAYDEALRLIQDSIILLRGFVGCVRYQRYLILCLRFSSWLHHAVFRSAAMETKRYNLKTNVDRFMERTQFLENLSATERPKEIEVPSEELIAVADVQVQNRLLTIAIDYWNEAEEFLKSVEHHRLFVGASESALDRSVEMTSPVGCFLRFVRESLARIDKYENTVLRPRSW